MSMTLQIHPPISVLLHLPIQRIPLLPHMDHKFLLYFPIYHTIPLIISLTQSSSAHSQVQDLSLPSTQF